jgi:predicted LPLAT superfamily acyltransferase
MKNQTPQWDGQSKAKILGYKIFVFILNTFGLSPAYFILRFVSAYYFLFSKPNKFVREFYVKALNYPKSKAFWSVYKNNYQFGQTILDKVAQMAGVKTKLKFISHNGEVLEKIAALGKGGILVSAHTGNWEIAGQGLNRLNTTFNVLMYENEKANIKEYMNDVMKKKKINVIAINEETKSHIIELHKAFTNNELVVMHGDRFREGAKTLTSNFFGHPAKFPAGPFIMAAKFGVPLCIVFANKSDSKTYQFYSTEPIEVPRARGEKEVEEACRKMLQRYVSELEARVKQYPHQWFNYYDFWA